MSGWLDGQPCGKNAYADADETDADHGLRITITDEGIWRRDSDLPKEKYLVEGKLPRRKITSKENYLEIVKVKS
jgi:hypothetical protein